MKNYKFCLIFLIIFIFLSAFLINKKEIFNFDIFSLTNYEISHKNEYLELQKKINKQTFFLFKNEQDLQKFINFSQKIDIFEKIFYKQDFNFDSTLLNPYKIAIFDDDEAKILLKNESLFFDNVIKKYFDPTQIKIKDDFFFLISDSKFLNQQNIIKIDENLYLKAKIDNEEFYFLYGILGKNLSNLPKLIKFCDENLEVIYSGSEILSLFGKNQGLKESLVFSVVTFILIFILFFLAFGRFYIFVLIFPVIFGLIFGLFFVILFFGKIHILTFIISSSLIGLMLDFATHFLGDNHSKIIEKKSIKRLKNIFLLGFCISASGYAVFLFSDFGFLKEIAIFSIFGLFGTMIFTYFGLSEILHNKKFTQNKNFMKFLLFLNQISTKFALDNKKFLIFFIIFLAMILFEICYLKSSENLKDYYQNSPKISKNLNIISKIMPPQTTILIPKNIDEKEVLQNLKNEGLFENFESISNFILDEKTQNLIIEKFNILQNDEEILTKFQSIGFNKNLVKNEFEKLANLKPKSQGEFCKILDKFCLNENYFLGYLKQVKNRQILEQKLQNSGIVVIDFVEKLNQNFDNLKQIALYLKIIGVFLAFLFLLMFFDVKTALKILFLILFSVVLTLFVFAIFRINSDIFAVFGLILASAVGIDYMIFAKNHKMGKIERTFGIFIASLTTIISFFILSFSATNAVRNFGFAISLTIFFIAIFAFLVSNEKSKNKFLKSS